LFVLLEGGFRIEKAGVQIATVTEPGACVGEMSLLLGVPATADVIASRPSVVAVIENADTMLEDEPAPDARQQFTQRDGIGPRPEP
jgi:CRP/FNR family transcriptional regulator, cyclic AMP receptor protein